MGDELLKKLDMFSETVAVGDDPQKFDGARAIQFLNWWGDFRPGDRVDVMFGEDYISLAGTNAEGHFAGVKKALDIDDEDGVAEFKNGEGKFWNFV